MNSKIIKLGITNQVFSTNVLKFLGIIILLVLSSNHLIQLIILSAQIATWDGR